MRFVVTHPSSSFLAAFDFTEPGGTIGRCPGNHLLLSEDVDVGRIQAVVRIRNDDCSLMNVSSHTEMRLNGRQLPMMQEMPFVQGDTLTIGAYTLQADTLAPPAAAVVVADTIQPGPEPDITAQDAQDIQDTSDIFKELLEGPGVLPVGLPAETNGLHPFELDSQAPRNHPDPMRLQDNQHRLPDYESAHERFNTEPGQHDSHIFSDPAPSTLNLQDPLAPQRKSLIDEALAHGHSSEKHHEKW